MSAGLKTVTATLIFCTSASPSFAVDKTWIDPGNEAKIIDWYGPFGSVCVAAIDAATGAPVTAHMRRKADGAGKDLANFVGSRVLDTKGLHYEVWVQNIQSTPIYAYDCGGKIHPNDNREPETFKVPVR